MITLIYIVWILIPLSYLLFTIWAWLEKVGGSVKKHNPGDALQQTIFLAACVGVAVLIEQYWLSDLCNALFPDVIPLLFYQIMLLPVILLIGSKVVGGTKPVIITKAPNPTMRKRK